MRLALKIARVVGPALVAGVCLGSAIAAGCGRIGIDLREGDAADAGMDAAADAATGSDAAPQVCPNGTVELAPGSQTCIEIMERGTETWVTADEQCAAAGRRLCSDAEWEQACNEASGLVDMFDDGSGSGSGSAEWEWTGSMVGSSDAKKRGLQACSDMAEHDIASDPYDFRCCVPKS
jgi:hypothetical protein